MKRDARYEKEGKLLEKELSAVVYASPGCFICIYFLLYTDVRDAVSIPGIQLFCRNYRRGICGDEIF